MIHWLRRTLHPAWYQGHGKGPPYFEGWYYKLVDSTEQHRLAVIPGIFRAVDPRESHAFIQVLDGTSGSATYQRYPVETFRAAASRFGVQIGVSRFTLRHIALEIDSSERSVSGSLRFRDVTPWPVTVTSPGVMGWFAWIPLLQTYHGVLSFDHMLEGTVSLDGQAIDFTDGRGYIEKDWGRSFPDAWVWMQTNHFNRPGTSFTASVATIPWLGTSFRGFIIGLWHEGHIYRFATYTGAKIDELSIDGGMIAAVISDRRHRLEVAAHGAEIGVLRGPTGLSMARRVPESLNAGVTVRLLALGGTKPRLIFEGTGRNAGLEVVGDRARLLK